MSNLKYCMCVIRTKMPELIASFIGRSRAKENISFIRTNERSQGKIQKSSNLAIFFIKKIARFVRVNKKKIINKKLGSSHYDSSG